MASFQYNGDSRNGHGKHLLFRIYLLLPTKPGSLISHLSSKTNQLNNLRFFLAPL